MQGTWHTMCPPYKKVGDTSPVFPTKLRPWTKDNYYLDGKTTKRIVSKTGCKRFSKKLKKIIVFCKHLPKKSLVERRITTLVNAFCLLNEKKGKVMFFMKFSYEHAFTYIYLLHLTTTLKS